MGVAWSVLTLEVIRANFTVANHRASVYDSSAAAPFALARAGLPIGEGNCVTNATTALLHISFLSSQKLTSLYVELLRKLLPIVISLIATIRLIGRIIAIPDRVVCRLACEKSLSATLLLITV